MNEGDVEAMNPFMHNAAVILGLTGAAIVLDDFSAHAQTWPPAAPQGDNRVFAVDIREDHAIIESPYNYTADQYGFNLVEEWAVWACSLYNRTPVYYSVRASDSACDELGVIAAQRSSSCWHSHSFACAWNQ